MLSDVIDAVSFLSWWELALVIIVSGLVASGICGVLGMGDDF